LSPAGRPASQAPPPPAGAASTAATPTPVKPAAAAGGAPPADLKSALFGAIREHNRTFFSMVIAQAQKVDVEGDTVTFTYAPIHKSLRAQLEKGRAMVEQLAQSAVGRRISIVVREADPVPAAASEPDAATSRRADLTARAKAEPAVQAVLDVFGGEIEDVEEV